jgi:hypothetical protein
MKILHNSHKINTKNLLISIVALDLDLKPEVDFYLSRKQKKINEAKYFMRTQLVNVEISSVIHSASNRLHQTEFGSSG